MTTPIKQTVFTLGQASVQTGKSKPTISRDIKKGKLSATKLKNGSYEINASELFRVYDSVTPVTVTEKEHVTNDNPQHRNKNSALDVEIKYLKEQVEDLKGRIKEQENGFKTQLEKEEKNTNKWEQQAQSITKLLENDKKEKPVQNMGLIDKLKFILK